MRKKLFAILLTLCMVLTMMPSAVFAEGEKSGEQLNLVYYDSNHNETFRYVPGSVGGNVLFYTNVEVYFGNNRINSSSCDISATHGTINKNVDGTFTYSPTKVGSDSIVVKYDNNTATFNVNVMSGDISGENQGGNQGSENLCLVFTYESLESNRNAEVLNHLKFQIPEGENNKVRKTVYLYTATYTNGQYNDLNLISEDSLDSYYVWEDTGNGPQYAQSLAGIEIATGEGLNPGQYVIEIDPSAYNYFSEGQKRYDIYPNGQNNCTPLEVRVNKGQPSSNNRYNLKLQQLQDGAEYEGFALVDGMAGFGQGRALTFTKKSDSKKIDKWYVCFYVENAVTGEAVTYNDQSSGNGRTYIGSLNDFVIQTREKDNPNADWNTQNTDENDQNCNEAYRIVAETGRTYQGTDKMFKISYVGDRIAELSEKYEYRLHYTGNDIYLNNGNQENNLDISLELNNEFAEYTIDMEEVNSGAEVNSHSFYRDKSDYNFKITVRPSMIKRVEDKIATNDVLYIKNAAKYIAFDKPKSPFKVTWNDTEECYTISYSHPKKDLYGPDYFVDNDKLINGYLNTTETHYIEEGIGFSTGKLTVRPDKIGHNNAINAADRKKEVDVTEVLFENGFQKSIQGNELNIDTNQGYISFTGSVVDNIKSESDDVSYEVRDVKSDSYYLEDEQKTALKGKEIHGALDFELTSGEEKIKFGSTGTAEIRIPMSDFDDTKGVYYLGDDGTYYNVSYSYDGQDVIISAKHFSTYVIVDKLSDEDVKEDPYVPEKNPTPPSGGGGGGAILPPAQEKPADEPVQSGLTTSTDLSGSTVNKGGQTTTTMDKTIADKIIDSAVSNKSEEVVINTVTKNDSASQSVKSAEVTLPAETLGAIAEKTDANVVIKTDVAEVKLDNKTAEAIAQQAAAVGATETVSIKAEKVKEEAKEVRFELKITTSSGAVISDFKGGNVSVTVNVPQSLANKKIVCVYIDENGKYHKVDGAINEEGTQYTFTTGHFSTYAVMSEEDAEAVIKQQTADEQKAKIKNVKATVTLSTKGLKKGIRVTVKVPDDQKADKTGIIIYRSTSKNAKTYAVYKKVATKKSTYIIRNTKNVKGEKLTLGKKYYYKVRAYKVIDGKTYYGPMSAVKYIKAK